jgi:twinkle protein
MNPKEVNDRLVDMVDSVACHLLPNGKREGGNWCSGSVAGEPGHSLKVCINGARAGLWSDFSSNSKGGDLLELWVQTKGISFIEALKEAKEFAGITDTQPSFYPERKKKAHVQKPSCTKPSDAVADWFTGRGITQSTLDAYKIGQQGNTIVFPFLSPEDKLELVKYRDLDAEKTGKKKIWSNQDPDYHLFGWQAINDNDRFVVLTEGEPDAMSYFQQGFPALSIPQGAGDGEKQQAWIRNDFERLERFETIYVSMDMDAPGQSAIKPIIEALGADRCKIVNLGEYKDANEVHADGELLKGYLDRAKTKDPDELKSLHEYHEEILKEFQGTGVTGARLPWAKTNSTIRLRPSEISLWAGVNSHGKSVLLNHVAVDCMAQGEKFCIASMEMKPEKLGRKMYQQIAGADMPDKRTASEILKFIDGRVWIFEAYGTTKADRVLEVFRYARRRYGVTHFIVDSLAKCGFGEDDYNGQKAFVDRLMEFGGEFNVHVHLVVHIRKLADESKIPGKMDVKGTGAITDMVDNVFIVWRNKPKEEQFQIDQINVPSNPDTVLNCVKQRETGEEPMVNLYFHRPSCQLLSYCDEPPKEYLFLER